MVCFYKNFGHHSCHWGPDGSLRPLSRDGPTDPKAGPGRPSRTNVRSKESSLRGSGSKSFVQWVILPSLCISYYSTSLFQKQKLHTSFSWLWKRQTHVPVQLSAQDRPSRFPLFVCAVCWLSVCPSGLLSFCPISPLLALVTAFHFNPRLLPKWPGLHLVSSAPQPSGTGGKRYLSPEQEGLWETSGSERGRLPCEQGTVFESPSHRAAGRERAFTESDDVTEIRGEVNTLMSHNSQFPGLFPRNRNTIKLRSNALHAECFCLNKVMLVVFRDF